MRFLVTGVNGQLGHDVVKELRSRGYNDILETDVEEMDITNNEEVNQVILDYRPDVVIHCAAYTQVDNAEDNYDLVYNINVNGCSNLVSASEKVGAKFIYISTDYVFDGTKSLNETYDINDECNPKSVYGKTKYLGELIAKKYKKHYIVRTSWVFGINGKNFVKTMLNLSDSKDEINVVSDQYGSPTYTVDLAKLLVDMSLTDKYGTYHANNSGYCSWAEFAEQIFKINNKNVKVNYIKTEDYKTKAERPKNSKLNKECLTNNGFELMPHYSDALIRYKKELEKEKIKKLEM